MDRNMRPPAPHLTPRIVFTEEPKQRGMRFRYECEGRSAGSIPGEHTTQDRKTWPSIQIRNYSGEVTVRVSLVSKDTPPRPHPHSLVGKDCYSGICTVRVSPDTQMSATFSNLGIQCVKRREVMGALKLRQSLRVDPFSTYNDNDGHSVDIDLNIVRLCVEAFVNNQHLALPILSNPIFDKKATSSSLLRICRVDRSFGSCKGGDEVYLLCDKVQKDDIQICFYESGSRGVIWEAYGEFSPTDVHRQVAIVFRTPPYRDPNLNEAIKVLFQLKRMSDGETSDSKDFTYLPQHHDQPQLCRADIGDRRRKTQTTKNVVYNHIVNKAARFDGPFVFEQRADPGFNVQMPQRPFPFVGPSYSSSLLPEPISAAQANHGRGMASVHQPSFQQWGPSPAPPMSSTPEYTTPIPNTSGLGADRGPIDGLQSNPTLLYTAPSPQCTERGDLISAHELADVQDSIGSFSGIITDGLTESIKQLSIDDIDPSYIVKAEPNTDTAGMIMEQYSSQAGEPPAYRGPGPAFVAMQVPSPHRAQSPQQPQVTDAAILNLQEAYLYNDPTASLPSYDLNEV